MPIILGIFILMIIMGVVRWVQEIIDGLSSSRRARASKQTSNQQPVRRRKQEQIRHIAGRTFNQYREITDRKKFNRFGEIEDQQGRR